MNKLSNLIWIVIILVISILFYFNTNSKSEEIIVPDHSGTIDSLQIIIDSLNQKQLDLKNQEDSVKIKFIEIEKEYETKYTDVASQSVNSDIRFFTEYINNFSKNY